LLAFCRAARLRLTSNETPSSAQGLEPGLVLSLDLQREARQGPGLALQSVQLQVALLAT
jgi:hypothetical protein